MHKKTCQMKIDQIIYGNRFYGSVACKSTPSSLSYLMIYI